MSPERALWCARTSCSVHSARRILMRMYAFSSGSSAKSSMKRSCGRTSTVDRSVAVHVAVTGALVSIEISPKYCPGCSSTAGVPASAASPSRPISVTEITPLTTT